MKKINFTTFQLHNAVAQDGTPPKRWFQKLASSMEPNIHIYLEINFFQKPYLHGMDEFLRLIALTVWQYPWFDFFPTCSKHLKYPALFLTMQSLTETILSPRYSLSKTADSCNVQE